MTTGMAIIGALPPLPVVLAAAALVGVAYGPIGPLTAVVVANRVAPGLRGRVFGVFNAARNLATSIALLLGGAALSGVSIGIGVTIAAFGCAVITIVQTGSRSIRYLDQPAYREEEPMEQPRTELDRRFSEPEAKTTEWRDTRAILEEAELSWISTVRADGRPHVTPLVPVWLDGAAYFTTGPDEQKARNLSHNPHVVITTGSAAWRHGTDITVEGKARQVTDADILDQLTEAWKAKWDGRWRFQTNDGGLFHEDGGRTLVFQVTPTKVLAFGKGGFSHTRHLFKAKPDTAASDIE
jgi:nitroimidazol reductase NimA-like FMN-containing flavoprotein (pyridoxamine 5'-phosphate oxidase superfamily)